MTALVLDVMDIQKGHEELVYNEDNPDEVKKIVEKVLDQIRLGWTLYGGKIGGELVKIADLVSLQKAPEKALFVKEKLAELDRFIMNKQMDKKLLAAPLTSG